MSTIWRDTALCELYSPVGRPPLSTSRLGHWCTVIYKAMLGLLASYVCNLITQRSVDSYGLRSNDQLLLSVPFARTELRKRDFVYSAPSTWNTLQKNWKITQLITLNAFKSRLRALETTFFTSNCIY